VKHIRQEEEWRTAKQDDKKFIPEELLFESPRVHGKPKTRSTIGNKRKQGKPEYRMKRGKKSCGAQAMKENGAPMRLHKGCMQHATREIWSDVKVVMRCVMQSINADMQTKQMGG
jgi:hypothetical protein